MKAHEIIWWCIVGVCLLPVGMTVGLAVGFVILQAIDPIFDHLPSLAGRALMIVTAALAFILIIAAFRSTGRALRWDRRS